MKSDSIVCLFQGNNDQLKVWQEKCEKELNGTFIVHPARTKVFPL